MGRGNTLPPALPASGRQDASGRRSKGAGMQLGRVAAVLADHGLDPAVELARVLTQAVPVMDKKTGAPLLDVNGQPVLAPVLDDDLRARIHLQLLEFTDPKLKSVEVKVDASHDLTDEQLQARIAQLLQSEARE